MEVFFICNINSILKAAIWTDLEKLNNSYQRRENTKLHVLSINSAPCPTGGNKDWWLSTNNCIIQLFRQRLSHKSVKAYATMRLVLWVERVWRWLILVHGVYQQEERRHRYICLCCFPLCHWNTLSLNQGPLTTVTHNTFWHCRVRFCWTTFVETAVCYCQI